MPCKENSKTRIYEGEDWPSNLRRKAAAAVIRPVPSNRRLEGSGVAVAVPPPLKGTNPANSPAPVLETKVAAPLVGFREKTLPITSMPYNVLPTKLTALRD